MRKFYYIFLVFFLSSCYQGHLYVQQERVNKSFLASVQIGTPDYRQKNPPKGIRVITSWDFPNSIYKKNLFAHLTVRFWNNEEKVIVFPLESKRGDKAIYFENLNDDPSKKILTYKLEIKRENGDMVEVWKHHFYKELIDVDKAVDKEESRQR